MPAVICEFKLLLPGGAPSPPIKLAVTLPSPAFIPPQAQGSSISSSTVALGLPTIVLGKRRMSSTGQVRSSVPNLRDEDELGNLLLPNVAPRRLRA